MFHKYIPQCAPIDSFESNSHVTFEKRAFKSPDNRNVEYITLKIVIDGVEVYFKPCIGHNAQALKIF